MIEALYNAVVVKPVEVEETMYGNIVVPDLGNETNKTGQVVAELCKMQEEIYQEEWLDRRPKLGNMWANINYPGGYNRPHIHPNCLFSGVYYVKGNKEFGELVVNDPRPGIQTMMPTRKPGQPPKHLWREAHIEPLPGRIIMFPAWLWHCVEPNQTNDIRISVSFNFIQDGFQ